MFKIGEKVVVKELDTLKKENHLKESDDLKGVYCNKDLKFVLFPDFNYFGVETSIQSIDDNDADIPYFLDIGIWVPEFMIKKKEDLDEKLEVVADMAIMDVNPNPEPEKVWINQFNGKKFGPKFVKLIKLDEKVAEFSNTAFSKLRKHELQYIAKLLQDHGAEKIDYNKLNKEDLAIYCNKAISDLHV